MSNKMKEGRKTVWQILIVMVACALLVVGICNKGWADESASAADTDREVVTPLDIPLYPNILETKQLDTHGIKGTITLYTTRDSMRDVVTFYTKALGRDDYRIIGNGWIEFVFGGEELPYTFEFPDYSTSEDKKQNYTKYYTVVWQSLVIHVDFQTGNTEIEVKDLDRESVITFWREQRQLEADMMKAGPRQIFLPPAGNNK